MVKSAACSSSPVTITVTPCKGSGDRSLGLTSPIPRASVINNQNSPLSSRATRRTSISGGNRRSSGGEGRYCSMSVEDLTAENTNSECVLSYTVHIPPTPDHQTVFASQESGMGEEDEMLKGNSNNKSFLSGTIFTGGFKSVTRGHVIDCSMDRADPEKKSGQICWLKGCDEKVVHGRCECGFKICRDCYFDCITSGGGNCPGCKEPYRDVNDDPETEEEDEEDEAKPLPQMGESKLDKRLSVVKSFKAQNQAGDFDHTRWLFETKGTYGYGNAVWPKDGYGIGSGGGSNGYETPPEFGERSKRPLTRKVSVSAAIISPYR